MIDFGAIISNSGYAWSHDYADVLAAKVPDLCPDCHGTGDRMHNGECIGACGHPFAPTFAKLLAIGAAVMGDIEPVTAPTDHHPDSDPWWAGRDSVVRYLRAVEP